MAASAAIVPRLAITPGEPAGIGPDVLLQASQRSFDCELVVVGDIALLRQRAESLNLPVTFKEFAADERQPHQVGAPLKVKQIKLAQKAVAGRLNPANAEYVMNSLQTAATGCLSGEFDGVVTGPVQKSIINDAGIPFSGHTEFFAESSGTDKVVMMLTTPSLKVALVTTHLPLSEVSHQITDENLTQTIQILHRSLQFEFAIANPIILVCGLNPHAGESGHLGSEEIEIISPVLDRLRAHGLNLIGPLPADTLFTAEVLKRGDAVLAMYHDQGLPVLKSQGFGEAVNITLGLPFVRTSVDHGTALDLAGTGSASESSLIAAIEQASHMAAARCQQNIDLAGSNKPTLSSRTAS